MILLIINLTDTENFTRQALLLFGCIDLALQPLLFPQPMTSFLVVLRCQLGELASKVLIVKPHSFIGLFLSHVLEMSNRLISAIDPTLELILATEPTTQLLLAL
jgi:hypothetical protein